MTRDEAVAEAERRRAAEPDATWTVTERDGRWRVVRIGLAPIAATGMATKPPPDEPAADPRGGHPNPNWGIG